jgi:death-on-curing family protein
LTEEFRGTEDAVDPPGVKDAGALQSAMARPQMAHALFPTVLLAAAALVHGLNASHAFHNGNKRTSLLALAIFLEERNRRYLDGSQSELFDLIVATASHDLVSPDDSPGRGSDPYYPDREVLAIYRKLRGMVHAPSRQDRPLKWRDLCRVLERFSCETDQLVGNQAKIRRTLKDGTVLMTVAGARNEGDESSARQVRQYRKDLHLTDEFGIDSAIFYDGREPHPELPTLIRRYRGVLERLALYDRAD